MPRKKKTSEIHEEVTPYQQGCNAANTTWHWVSKVAPIGIQLEQADCMHRKGSSAWKQWHHGFNDQWERRQSKVKRSICVPVFKNKRGKVIAVPPKVKYGIK